MKRIPAIAAGLVILISASVSAFAQTRPAPTTAPPAAPQTPVAVAPVPATKMALLDTTQFADEKAGIVRYVRAARTVQGEFATKTAELQSLQTRIKALSDEITKLAANPVVGPESIKAKQDEGERLQRELKYKQDQAAADYQKRLEQVVGPISTDIGKALDLYASQHGLTMILDISKILPAILTISPAVDITQPFIAEYNSKNP
ncbi:MAG: OmpH family outer membrane protein [Acidobacteriota bacterium]